MAAKCFNCGKGVMYGHNVSHAKNRTRKIFKPNLHSSSISISGVVKRVKLCTKCQRQLKSKNLKLKLRVEEPKSEVSPAASIA